MAEVLWLESSTPQLIRTDMIMSEQKPTFCGTRSTLTPLSTHGNSHVFYGNDTVSPSAIGIDHQSPVCTYGLPSPQHAAYHTTPNSAFVVAGTTAHPILPLGKLHSHENAHQTHCLLYTSPSPRDRQKSRMPSSA